MGQFKWLIAFTAILIPAVEALELSVGSNSDQLNNLKNGIQLDGIRTNIDSVENSLLTRIEELQAEIDELKKKKPKSVLGGQVLKPASHRYANYQTNVTFEEPFEKVPDVMVTTEEETHFPCRGSNDGLFSARVSDVTPRGFTLIMPGRRSGCITGEARSVIWTAIEPERERVACRGRTVQWGNGQCTGRIKRVSHMSTGAVADPNEAVSVGDRDYYGSATFSCNDGALTMISGSCQEHYVPPPCPPGTRRNASGRCRQER